MKPRFSKCFFPGFLITVCLLLASGCTNAARKKRAFERAEKYFKASDYPKAEIEYLNARQYDPKDPLPYQRLGIIYFEQGRTIRAFSFLQYARQIAPQDVEVRTRFGLLLAGAGKVRDARDEALFVIGKQPTNEDALTLYADTVTSLADVDSTMQQLAGIRRSSGDSSGLRVAEGSLLIKRREVDKAEQAFKEAVRLNPRSSAAHLALGSIALMRSNMPAALVEFKAAADSGPIRSPRHLRYTELLMRSAGTNGLAEAKIHLEELNKKAPDYLPYYEALFRIAFAQKRYSDCESIIKSQLFREPASVEALVNRIKLRMAERRYSDAIVEAERALSTLPKIPEIHRMKANAHLALNDTTKASASLEQVLQLVPDDAEATLILNDIRIRRGDAKTAIVTLESYFKRHTNNFTVAFALADAYRNNGRPELAVNLYNEIAPKLPKDPRPALFRCMAFRQLNRPVEARRSIEIALAIDPGNIAAVDQQTDLDIIDGKWDRAKDRLTSLITKAPNVPVLHFLLARVHLLQKQSAPGIAAAEKAIEIDPNFRPAYLLLAEYYASSRQHPAAIARFEQLIEKNPKDAQALMQLGMIKTAVNDVPGAQKAYEQLLVAFPNHIGALNNLSYIYSENLNRLDDALKLAERAHQQGSQDPYMGETLGWIHFRKGNYAEALPLIKDACDRIVPPEGEAFYHLGMVHYMLGEPESALFSFQRALSISTNFTGRADAVKKLAALTEKPLSDPASEIAAVRERLKTSANDPILMRRLGTALEKSGDFSEAIKVYETTLEKNPDVSGIQASLAILYSRHLKDSKKALALIRQARKAAEDDPNVLLSLARTAADEKDFPLAVTLYQDALRKSPDNAAIGLDLARINFSLGRLQETRSALRLALDTTSVGHAQVAQQAKLLNEYFEVATTGIISPALAARVPTLLAGASNDLGPRYLDLVLKQSQKKNQEAISGFARLLGEFPQFTPAKRHLAVLKASATTKDEETFRLAVAAREAFPADPLVAKALGLVTWARGDAARSVQILSEVATKRTNDAEVLYPLAFAQYQLRRTNDFRITAQKALSAAPNSPDAMRTRELLGPAK